jgi:Aspartyl/Asparaginyl beta-hydroxylase
MLRNFRQVMSGIDPDPLLRQIEQNPQLWSQETEWTHGKVGSAIYKTDNIVLRYNRSSAPGLNDWDKPAFSTLSEAQPIILDLMRAIPGEHLGKVVITRMRPKEAIESHIDLMPPGISPYFQRYQIPLSVDPGVVFYCGGEQLWMEPGMAWWFDNQAMHGVVNWSGEDRISMLTDIRPFTPI